ncbi:peroxiredoxin [Sphingomonas rhizophila]|jgi:peroxiredoxin Q/BCP|uniref:thioredoxin-dependent peroxiredoxin n=1 Tax=Sphingomonas rhizophila TaxID=2071607 RepID=A0A7G9SAE3_9SPHN|nr:peroxiredoxin [Sphingomonas rhizophila]QNN64818.1 peroxiredoxin [Sphingomonas rhizophila]
MRHIIAFAAIALAAAAPLGAALAPGAKAPDFRTLGAIGGKAFKLHLYDQLKKGPVVLYFYPKAFTSGCTLEARAFSEAMPEFRKAGAQVIGMSADSLPDLKRFSVEACRSAFPVATASRDTIKAYDVMMPGVGMVKTMSNRTSYVIDRNGTITEVHSEMDWKDHVGKTLAAVRELKRK